MHADVCHDLADSLHLLVHSVDPATAGRWLRWPLSETDARTPIDLIRSGQIADFSGRVSSYVTSVRA